MKLLVIAAALTSTLPGYVSAGKVCDGFNYGIGYPENGVCKFVYSSDASVSAQIHI